MIYLFLLYFFIYGSTFLIRISFFLSVFSGFSCCIYYLRWFICEETALCLWTGVLYVAYLKANIALAWYDVFLEVSFAVK